MQDAGREASVVVDVTKCGKLKTVRAEVTVGNEMYLNV